MKTTKVQDVMEKCNSLAIKSVSGYHQPPKHLLWSLDTQNEFDINNINYFQLTKWYRAIL